MSRRHLPLPFLATLFFLACGQGGEPAPGSAASEPAASSPGSGAAGPGATGAAAGSGFVVPLTDGQAVDVTALGYDMGTVMAPIRIIEFSDFGCVFCRQFHEETFPALREEFVEAGHVAWKFIPFDLGSFPNSGRVALAAECALEQDAMDPLRSILFRAQDEWKAAPAEQARELIDGYASEAGLDRARFGRCLDEGLREDRHEASNQAARAIGVRGTPTFIIDGQSVQGAPPLELFQEYLRERVAELGR